MSESVFVDVVGFLASVTAFVLFLPQALLTWRRRGDVEALRGVALGTQVVLLANAGLWGLYGVLTEAFWVAAPGLLNAPLAVLTIALVLRSRRWTPAAPVVQCGLCEQGAWHRVFVTAAPGWGSVMTCNGQRPRYGVIVSDPDQLVQMRMQRP